MARGEDVRKGVGPDIDTYVFDERQLGEDGAARAGWTRSVGCGSLMWRDHGECRRGYGMVCMGAWFSTT